MALCLIFPRAFALQWLAMLPSLLWLFANGTGARTRPRFAYAAGLFYFLPFYLVLYHWFLTLNIASETDMTRMRMLLTAVLCWLALSLFQAALSALIFPLFVYLTRTRVLQRLPLLAPFLFAAQYTVAEWSQTLTFLGLPWGRLSLGQIECGVLAKGAAVLGSYYITFALTLFAGLLAFGLLHLSRIRFCTIGAATVLIFSILLGVVGAFVGRDDTGAPVVVAAVQGNVGTQKKWEEEQTALTYEIYRRYTNEAVEAGATLVVFPETFLPYTLNAESSTGQFVSSLAAECGVTILCGAFHEEGDASYNAVFAIHPDGSIDETVYAKRHLVPFGEYVPARAAVEMLIPPLAELGMLEEDLTSGEGSALFETEHGRIGALVCFDSIYEELARDSVRDGAELLVLPTNDSWFSDSVAAHMHNAQARQRAIENGRWIVRAADTGVSAIIDPSGELHAAKGLSVEGLSVYTVRMGTRCTPYTVIGNLIVYLMIAALLAIPVVEIMERRKGITRA